MPGRLEYRAALLNVARARVPGHVLGRYAQYAHIAHAVVHVLVPVHLHYAAAHDVVVLDQPRVEAVKVVAVEYPAHYVGRVLGVLLHLRALGREHRLGHVVHLVGYLGLYRAQQHRQLRLMLASLGVVELVYLAAGAHALVVGLHYALVLVVEVVHPVHVLPLLGGKRLLAAQRVRPRLAVMFLQRRAYVAARHARRAVPPAARPVARPHVALGHAILSVHRHHSSSSARRLRGGSNGLSPYWSISPVGLGAQARAAMGRAMHMYRVSSYMWSSPSVSMSSTRCSS